MIYYILPSPLVKMPGNGVPSERHIITIIDDASADENYSLQIEGRGHKGDVCIQESEIPEIARYTRDKLEEFRSKSPHPLDDELTIRDALGQVLSALEVYRARSRRVLKEHSEN